jgi:peptide subunit release factor 1 (eRF1)
MPDWEAIKSRVMTFIDDYKPSSKTLAVFATADDLISHELPISLDSRSGYGEALVSPLIWALDEYERYLVVVVDQERAKFMTAYLGRANTLSELTIDIDDYDFAERTQMPPSDSDNTMLRQGNNRESYEDMISEFRHRFYKDIASEITTLVEKTQADRVIIGGAERSAHAVKDILHASIQDKVTGILPIPMQLSDADVASQILTHAQNVERDYELDLVKQIIDRAKSGGRGALGKDDVKRALQMGQVETLVLPFPPQDEDFATEVTLLALQNNCQVELVHGSSASTLQDEGGVGAMLYYSLETEATS